MALYGGGTAVGLVGSNPDSDFNGLDEEQWAFIREQTAIQNEQQDKLINAQIDAANRSAQNQADIAHAQIDSANRQTALAEKTDARAQERWDFYKTTYQPKEMAFIQEAWAGEDPSKAVAAASADVSAAFAKSRDNTTRQLASYGIDPGSGKFQGLLREQGIAEALADASARNTARQNIKDQNYAKKAQVVGMGLGLPSEATSMAATSSQQQNAAGNSLSGASNSYAAGTSGLLNAYSSGISAMNNRNNDVIAGMGLLQRDTSQEANRSTAQATNLVNAGTKTLGTAAAFFGF